MPKQSTIYFWGGAGAVTGSNFLLDTGGSKLLIDCGLQQGEHSFEDANWQPFPYNPSEIPFLLNTHAHIDHIGRIPKLVRDGFRGTIISTEATKALALPMLLDAMELLRHSAQRMGKEPLYDEKDIEQAMQQWKGVPYHQRTDLEGGVSVELLNAGHILGSAMAKFKRGERSIIFTGDLGGGNSPLLPPNDSAVGANYLVMESVYGNRVRGEQSGRRDALEDIIEDTARRGGTLLVPAFSTERTQDLLFEIRSLMVEKRIPSLPVFLDSPLAEKITASYLAYPQYFSEATQESIKKGEKIFSFPQLQYVHDTKASAEIDKNPGPKIILAGSGMSNGGRVLGHEKHVLPDPKSTLLIVGYQVAGSLGRRLLEGQKSVVIYNEKIPVHARVEALYSYSAHMDGEQLLDFVQNAAKGPLKEVFAVMGEPAAAGFLVQRIRDFLSIKASAPEAGEKATIEF